jgi:DEAD/DEAH box helicase domain-containing protein
MKEVYLDIETLRWSEEVEGGWSNIPAFGMALAVTWAEPPPGFTAWGCFGVNSTEVNAARDLIAYLLEFDRIITFNGERFDFKVLSAYGDVSGLYERSFDLLAVLQKKLGHRVSLDNLARATLHRSKIADGLKAVQWWRSGEPELQRKVLEYCVEDVAILRDLVLWGRNTGFLKYLDRTEISQHVLYGDRDGLSMRVPYEDKSIEHEPAQPIEAMTDIEILEAEACIRWSLNLKEVRTYARRLSLELWRLRRDQEEECGTPQFLLATEEKAEEDGL